MNILNSWEIPIRELVKFLALFLKIGYARWVPYFWIWYMKWRNNYENGFINTMTNTYEMPFLSTHAQLSGISKEDIDFWTQSILEDKDCMESLFPDYSRFTVAKKNPENQEYAQSVRNWFLDMKNRHGYSAVDFKVMDKMRETATKLDKKGVVFNHIVELMTASVMQALLDEANMQWGLWKNIKVYKTSIPDDMLGHIDYVIEIDGQCVGIDLATSDSAEYIREKSQMQDTFVVEHQMFRQEEEVKKGTERYKEVHIPRKVLAIEKNKMFSILSEYMETVTQVNGEMSHQDVLDSVSMGIANISKNPKWLMRHFKAQVLQLIAA